MFNVSCYNTDFNFVTLLCKRKKKEPQSSNPIYGSFIY
ncbi:hypothetical protein BC059799_0490 [Bacillus cereus NVH0597-99]|nr:hypothetical protein BC059799_0490 [Bacillus cereus NVH0597-99]